jgi:hypothetical protein
MRPRLGRIGHAVDVAWKPRFACEKRKALPTLYPAGRKTASIGACRSAESWGGAFGPPTIGVHRLVRD